MKCDACGQEYQMKSKVRVAPNAPRWCMDLRQLDAYDGPIWWNVVENHWDSPENASLRDLVSKGLARIRDGGVEITDQGRAKLYSLEVQKVLSDAGYDKPLEKRSAAREPRRKWQRKAGA